MTPAPSADAAEQRARTAASALLGDLEGAFVLQRDREDSLALIHDHRPAPAHADVERPPLVGHGDAAVGELDSAGCYLLGDLQVGPYGHRTRVEDVDAPDRDQNPEEGLHPVAPGR